MAPSDAATQTRASRRCNEQSGVRNAKDIQELSMLPSEGELLILPNTDFKVKLALSCDQARMLNVRCMTIPDHMGLVIPEAAPPDASSSWLKRCGVFRCAAHAQPTHCTLVNAATGSARDCILWRAIYSLLSAARVTRCYTSNGPHGDVLQCTSDGI